MHGLTGSGAFQARLDTKERHHRPSLNSNRADLGSHNCKRTLLLSSRLNIVKLVTKADTALPTAVHGAISEILMCPSSIVILS